MSLFSKPVRYQFLLLNTIVTVCYFFAFKLSMTFATIAGGVASVWLPSALTLGLMFWFGYQLWPAIALGSFLGISSHIFIDNPELSLLNFWLINIACAAGNIAQPCLATFLIQRYTEKTSIFRSVRSVLIFIVAAILSPMLSASLGVISLNSAGLIEWPDMPLSWLTWWLASALAHLIFSPVIMLWPELRQFKATQSRFEILVMAVIFSVIGYLTFIRAYPLEYLFLPLLIWIAFSYGEAVTSVFVSLVSWAAIIATSQELGPFDSESANTSLLLLQSFIAILALTSLILCALIHEKKQTQAFQVELERRVRERTEQLVIARAEAEAAHAVKSRFMSNVSHEMLTPLQGIVGFADLGKNNAMKISPESSTQYFDRILISGLRMQTLVQSLLNLVEDAQREYAQIEEHDLQVVSVEEFVRRGIKALHKSAENRKQTIVLNIKSRGISIKIDPYRLGQAFQHLLANALRYSPEQSVITVVIERQVNAQNDNQVSIQVLDEGCGVPEKEMEAIFEPFYESSRTASGAGSTGLGLTLCKSIVKRHQGTLTVANRPGGGAMFQINLPLDNGHG